MHIIIAALGVLAAVYFFVIRARNAADMAGELADMANDVRLAARRFGFRRQTNVHPVETIEDPKLAIGAIGTAFLELDELPTKEQRDALNAALEQTLHLDSEAVQEMSVLGHWFVAECQGAATAIPRLSRKLYKLGGQEAFQPLLTVIDAVAYAGSGGLNPGQQDTLDDIKRAFRIN